LRNRREDFVEIRFGEFFTRCDLPSGSDVHHDLGSIVDPDPGVPEVGV
jgi:hypothetical protein